MTGGPLEGVRREARIDTHAFADNLRALLNADDSFVLDARADAFGHGAARLVRLALDTGVATVRVSPHQVDLPGVKRSSLMTVSPRRRVVAAEAYGLTDGTSPVLSLVGEITALVAAEEGSGVSKGFSHHTADATTLAVVALGYADGVPRLASNRAEVLVGGARRPVVGTVTMDQFVVDCGSGSSSADFPAVGDPAVLFGRDAASAQEWAAHSERSALELTAGLGTRILRVYS